MSRHLALTKLRGKAEAFGLAADDIVNFVYKRQELYRDERAAEHADRAAEAERDRGS